MSNSILPDEYEPLEPRKNKAIPVAKRRPRVGSKATIARTVKRTPEVMVKISSSAKNMRKVAQNVDYISRQGTVPLEDESGNVYIGEHAKADALETWERIPAEGGKRRETFNIIFSMPAGTPREEVTEAVRRFAADKFKNHQYLFATHNDEDHPHVHVIVKAEPLQGRKQLNPRKVDLQRWREGFAEQLRGQGIEANATPRAARGVTRKPDKQAVIHINERAKSQGTEPAKVTESQKQAALDELQGKLKPEPFKAALLETRKQVNAEYGNVARQLVNGGTNDKRLALNITQFVQSLPPVETQHKRRVAELQQQPEQDKGPER